MFVNVFVVLCLVNLIVCQGCYWNDGCMYQFYSTVTPYDAVRGDIRDYPVPQNCSAVSLWSLHRHGNRNPGSSVVEAARVIADLKQEIIDSYFDGRGQLCAQDIDNFKKWKWNETIEESASFLTGTGYEEVYEIGKRLKEKYPHLMEGTEDDFYFRTTDEQRTVTSASAFVHGLTEDSILSLAVDGPWSRDDVIRPYENCDRYQQEVKTGALLEEQINDYLTSQEYVTVQKNVQNRLGISTELSAEDVYSIYEICRFYRSWEPNLKSPWCAAFTHHDLEVLEYRDDIRHYYRNAHGSWVNKDLGKLPLKDLFERFDSYVHGESKKVVSYFTHDTMVEMTITALELFLDPVVIQGAHRNPNRVWRTSKISCFASNFIAVLNRCEEPTGQAYRVQFFHNEQVTSLCPLEGCSWQQFRNKFQGFSSSNLDFCTSDTNRSAAMVALTSWMLALGLAAHL